MMQRRTNIPTPQVTEQGDQSPNSQLKSGMRSTLSLLGLGTVYSNTTPGLGDWNSSCQQQTKEKGREVKNIGVKSTTIERKSHPICSE